MLIKTALINNSSVYANQAPEESSHSLIDLIRGLDRKLSNFILPKLQSAQETDCWLDAKAAASYMSLSASSFDKYRYQSNPKIKGHKLDGKSLYKKSDLDTFIKIYEIKSNGLA